ncbi:hypothetical protein H7Y63_02790 [Polaromonas sp.]|nr:hypothetical protein [Candidatus Saccharibacteria bacterium]
MRFKAYQYLGVSQLIFGLCLLGCFILIPHYFLDSNQGGISNYGTEAQTSALFILGFGSAALGSLVAAIKLGRSVGFSSSLYWLALSYLFVLVSTFTYKQNTSQRALHELSAVVLLFAMLLVVFKLRKITRHDVRAKIALIIFMVGFLLGCITSTDIIHMLFTAEVLCALSFGYLLTRGAWLNQSRNM